MAPAQRLSEEAAIQAVLAWFLRNKASRDITAAEVVARVRALAPGAESSGSELSLENASGARGVRLSQRDFPCFDRGEAGFQGCFCHMNQWSWRGDFQ
jgi:hypothetical protein